MFQNWPKPLVIGHRGACAHAPENTLASFNLAVQHQADAIEFDVKLSSDLQVVVIHDQSVDRTTNGKGIVKNLTLKELRTLDAGGKYSSKYSNEKIPTLDEVFESLGNRILMNVELTNYSTPFDDLVSKVIDLVKKHRLEDRVFFSSFLKRNLLIARHLLPAVPCGLLAYSGWMGYFPRQFGWRKGFQALHPYLTDVNQTLVQTVHSAGKRIHVWTVNGEDNIRMMLNLKVDGIFSDDPGLVRQIMDKG